MPTFDPFGFDTEIPPNDNLQALEDKMGQFQNKFNNLESDLKAAIIPSNPIKPPSGLKVPGKIFDPVFGPNIIFGFVMTSDFMSFCDYKPLARVGDLVFVVGIVGITVVAEIGVITSGCMDVRNNSIGSGTPFPGGPGTGGLKGGCTGQKASQLYNATINADFLSPGILNRIDPCLNSGNLANCLPSIVQDILGLCDNSPPNLGYGVANDFHLDNVIQQFGATYLSKLNNMLKNGFCGNAKLDVKFTPNINSKVPQQPCNVIKVQDNSEPGSINAAMSLPEKNPYQGLPSGIAGGASTMNGQCVTEHMNYLSQQLDSRSGFSFNNSLGDFISKHDLEVISLTNDIKNYYDKEFGEQARNMLNIFPDEFPLNSAEAINLALQISNDITNGKTNNDLTVSSYKNIVDEMKSLQSKLQSIVEKPLDAVGDMIRNDPELNRFWGELLRERDDSLNSLRPPPPDNASVCPTGPGLFDNNGNVLTGCSELADLQKAVKDGLTSILEMINGKAGKNGVADKNGLIANSMFDLGIRDVRKATGAAGMNPIDSMGLFRKASIDKIQRCMKQTAKIKALFQYFEKESYSLASQWGLFSAVFAASPRDPITQSLLSTGALEAILQAIQMQCLTLPQQAVEQFALESSDMMSDIRNFNFVSMDPNMVALNPSLAAMIANPAILMPISNLGMILSSAQAAVQQAIQNAMLIRSQLDTIFPSKEAMLAEMMAYVNNIVQAGIDSLKSLEGCFPPLPCIDFSGLFNFDMALNLSIGFPFKLKFPVMDLAFPNIDFKLPIVFPTLVAPTGFNLALNVELPKIKFPRIPKPPLFPPNFTLPTIRLPSLNFPLDLSRLNNLIPKFPNAAFNLPIPQFKLPRFSGIIIPPITVKLPHYNMRFGGFPFPKLDVRLPKFPIHVGFHMPISFDIKIPIPSISLKLPQLPKFPLLDIPKITINVPSLTIPFSGGLAIGSPTLPKISITFPPVTIPSLCGDKGKTIDELIADGKNIFNRIVNMGISGGRPLAVANCSLFVSPHFHGWIAPIPCSAMATDFSKCACMA